MKGPWWAFLVQGSPQIFLFLWSDPNENNYWLPNMALYILAIFVHSMQQKWGQKCQPSFGLGPALDLQWTLPWPYNTPDMALYI